MSRRTPRLDRQVKEWVTIAQASGWTIRYTAQGHVQFRSPDKSKKPTVIPARPGEYRSLKNSEAQLRAAGFPFPLKSKEETRVADDRDREAGSTAQRQSTDAAHDERRGSTNGSKPEHDQAVADVAGRPATLAGSDGGEGPSGVLHDGRREGTDSMGGDAQAGSEVEVAGAEVPAPATEEQEQQPLKPPADSRKASTTPKGNKPMATNRKKLASRPVSEAVRHATTDEWVAVSELLYDYSYQRPLVPTKVNSMTRDFNPDAIGVIYVSRRENGDQYVIDGQHRIAVMVAVGWGDQKIEAHVYEGLTVPQEAELWVLYNEHRTKPRPVRLFLAKVIAGEEVPVAITKVLHEHGTEVKEGSGYIQSPQAVTRIFTKGGRQLLGDTVDVVLNAYGRHDTAGMSADTLLAVAQLLSMFPTIDRKRLARKMSEVSAHKAVADAKQGRMLIADDEGHHPSTAVMMARTFMVSYNKSLRGGKLRWDDNGTWAFERSGKGRENT